ncbi:uncharacterized protein M421DRAFT_424512 [Didymella exigua CBS 183.55]|uniref:Uncharacterized protein n=1 Tax=Didymella exigua CBS 183.55 TaxID=1150837 RepID=A0A6A5R8S6_9PLEO|nr:uncharacterized protein M421DRAFT_424512 [Didymella exigua CBS 183.55]KAF1924631.1 hypothetical protein M421DRAFT_424512 [Didymella exigua CBS 183.55]
MYTPALIVLLTTTALALPKPSALIGVPSVAIPESRHAIVESSHRETGVEKRQSFLTGLPGVYMPSHYPGCVGGAFCPEWYMRQIQREDAERAAREKDLSSLQVRQERADDEAGVFYCQDVDWQGECVYNTTALGSDPKDCAQLNLPASSIGPDEGYYCIFYTNAVCAPIASDGSDALTLSFPGSANLMQTDKGDFNDRLLSYQCFREDKVEPSPPETAQEVAQEREAAMHVHAQAERQ